MEDIERSIILGDIITGFDEVSENLDKKWGDTDDGKEVLDEVFGDVFDVVVGKLDDLLDGDVKSEETEEETDTKRTEETNEWDEEEEEIEDDFLGVY